MVGNGWNKNTGVQVEHGVESTAGRLVDLLLQVGAISINEIVRYSPSVHGGERGGRRADERTHRPTLNLEYPTVYRLPPTAYRLPNPNPISCQLSATE